MLTAAQVSLQALCFSIGINHSSLIGKCPVLKRRNLLLGSGNGQCTVHCLQVWHHLWPMYNLQLLYNFTRW